MIGLLNFSFVALIWNQIHALITLTKPCQSLNVFPTISCSFRANCVMFCLIFFSSKLMKIKLTGHDVISIREKQCMSLCWLVDDLLKELSKTKWIKKKGVQLYSEYKSILDFLSRVPNYKPKLGEGGGEGLGGGVRALSFVSYSIQICLYSVWLSFSNFLSLHFQCVVFYHALP